MSLTQYKNPTAKECMDELENWIKEDTSFEEMEHLQEWINLIEDLFNLQK